MTSDVFAEYPINAELLATFHGKPHPVLRDGFEDRLRAHEEEHDLVGLTEMAIEARASHHLLDLLGVPCPERSYLSNLDARVWRAVVGAMELRERLARIENWHQREQGPAGTFDDVCNECGHDWPCETYRMATEGLSDGE